MRTRALLWLLGALLVVPALAKKPPRPPIPINGRPTVNLSVNTAPRVKAQVTWGGALLGDTPLTLPWPKDSGPVDVVVKADGYVPVHTRLYTTGNDGVTVKLTAEAEKSSLFGYKRELPPPAPDGGVAPVPAVAPPDGGSR